MAIRQNTKQPQLEKRLEQLNKQLYGLPPSYSKTAGLNFQQTKSEVNKQPVEKSEVAYLKQDLLKIFLLSFLALGLESLIYFGFKNNIINKFVTNVINLKF